MILTLVLYFIPALVALLTSHKQRKAIAVMNLLTGWTLVGWIVCLVWSIK